MKPNRWLNIYLIPLKIHILSVREYPTYEAGNSYVNIRVIGITTATTKGVDTDHDPVVEDWATGVTVTRAATTDVEPTGAHTIDG